MAMPNLEAPVGILDIKVTAVEVLKSGKPFTQYYPLSNELSFDTKFEVFEQF